MRIIERKKEKTLLPDVLTELLPPRLCEAIASCGAGQAEELRIHAGRLTTVTCGGRNYATGVLLSQEEVTELFSAMCGGSIYAYQSKICNGYITLPGGIRVGVCGSASVDSGRMVGVGEISGLVVRLPHCHRVSAEPILKLLREAKGVGGVLLFSPPGVGKTTCLRAAARAAADPANGIRTVVVDTRAEFSGTLEGENLLLDILVGYPQEVGIDIAVRTLGAELIICDEIGTDDEARSLLLAANRGVPILASAHARSFPELFARPGIERLHRAKIFVAYVKLLRNGFGGFDYVIRSWEETDDRS